MTRSMLFYSDWPLGYHNREAERKAIAFAEHGLRVFYVAGIGTRNPRLSSARKLVDRTRRTVGSGAGAGERDGSSPHPQLLETAALAVAPPRQVAVMRRMNGAWVERQLRRSIPGWSDAVAWVRHATPELVDALARLRPQVVVYEAVDAHHATPGMVGVWRDIFERAERALVSQADVVAVTNRSLGPRFQAWGADVRFVPHGVDLFPWSERPPDRKPADRVLGFIGTLDIRVDTGIVRHVARARPEWRIRLIGPVERGFDPEALADLPNVTVEPPVEHARIGEILATFDVGLMPYAASPVYEHMSPLKNLEVMAAGRPAVVRSNAELSAYSDLVYFAQTPEEFVSSTERALAEDSPALARGRRQRAEENAWEPRLAQLTALVDELLTSASR